MIRLSERLSMSAALVTPGSRVADVGCDHAHMGIWLLENGIASSCIGMDVRPGPLGKARENLERFGMQEKIELRLSDGLKMLSPGEADSIIIAGMGGILTVRILTEGLAAAHAARELILQPQSHLREVREFLEREGFVITDEDMCFEEGKFYTAMRAVSGRGDAPLTPAQLEFGPVLLAKKHPVLRRLLEFQLSKCDRRIEEIRGGAGGAASEKYGYFETLRELIRQSLYNDLS